LWINLVTDTCLVLPLGLEPAEQGYMKRPPRRPKAPLLHNILIARIVIVAVAMATVTLSIVTVLASQGFEVAYIQSVAFMALIAGQWANAFNARGEDKSSFSRLKTTNPGFIIGLVIAITLQMLVMFGPLGSILGVVHVPGTTLLVACAIMVGAVILVSEVHKQIVKMTKKQA
jgi:magnesium-transporting ATPase (P-type)